jgi:hypothetical protein
LLRWRGRARGRKISVGAEPTLGEELADDAVDGAAVLLVVAAPLPSMVVAHCGVRRQGGVGDRIPRVSRVLG